MSYVENTKVAKVVSMLNGNKHESASTIHSNSPKVSLIEDISSNSNETVELIADEVPLMDLMMAAQAEAKKEKDMKSKKKTEKESKTFGSTFKAGFLNNQAKSQNSKSVKGKTHLLSNSNANIGSVTSNSASSDNNTKQSIPTITRGSDINSKNKSSHMVLDDVQNALNNDVSPMIQQLQQGNWMTPDLMNSFQSNALLASGFKNPKCMAAIQLMQHDPKEAMKRFQGDPEIEDFLKEFGRVMSNHFTGIATTATATDSINAPIEGSSSLWTPPPIQELGPLHSDVLKKHSSTSSSHVDGSDDEKVKAVLQDEELRSMLMDPELQFILKECNDPVKLQYYLRDPIISAKFRKLYDAGLIGVAK